MSDSDSIIEKTATVSYNIVPPCPSCGKAMVRVLIQVPGEEFGHWHPAWMCDCLVAPEQISEDTTTPLQGFQRIGERPWHPGAAKP